MSAGVFHVFSVQCGINHGEFVIICDIFEIEERTCLVLFEKGEAIDL